LRPHASAPLRDGKTFFGRADRLPFRQIKVSGIHRFNNMEKIVKEAIMILAESLLN
jgi:hypothetical protein